MGLGLSKDFLFFALLSAGIGIYAENIPLGFQLFGVYAVCKIIYNLLT